MRLRRERSAFERLPCGPPVGFLLAASGDNGREHSGYCGAGEHRGGSGIPKSARCSGTQPRENGEFLTVYGWASSSLAELRHGHSLTVVVQKREYLSREVCAALIVLDARRP